MIIGGQSFVKFQQISFFNSKNSLAGRNQYFVRNDCTGSSLAIFQAGFHNAVVAAPYIARHAIHKYWKMVGFIAA